MHASLLSVPRSGVIDGDLKSHSKRSRSGKAPTLNGFSCTVLQNYEDCWLAGSTRETIANTGVSTRFRGLEGLCGLAFINHSVLQMNAEF